MGFVNSVKVLMGYDEESVEEEIFESTDEGVRFRDLKGASPRRALKPQKKDKVVRMYKEEEQDELVIMQPGSFEDTEKICERMKERKPVIVNIESMDTQEAQRAIDFLCGAVCALDSKINKVSSAIFAIVPTEMDISGDIREDRNKSNSFSF